MGLKAVFFDLDDTLCDTTGTRLARAERAFQRLQVDLPGLDRDWFVERAVSIDPATGWAAGVRPLLRDLGLLETAAGREAQDLWFFQGCFELLTTYPGARNVVRTLSDDYLLGVITNGTEARQRPKFENLMLDGYFKVFLTSERAGAEKPSPAIFRHALSEAGVEAAEAAFLGDRLDIDVAGAKAAGLYAIWLDHVGWSPSGLGPSPDAVIRDFRELPSLLTARGGPAHFSPAPR